MDLAAVAERFENFAAVEAVESSPLYWALALRVKEHPELLEIAGQARTNQPRPHLMFGAVQYLLRKEGKPFDPEEGVDRAFHRLMEVARDQRAELLDLLAHKIVQTNEVRRAIYLHSAFGYLGRLFPGREFALVEIGASAGFNLLFDRYRYQFDDGPLFGALNSSVRVRSTLRGEGRPPMETSVPPIVSRTGVDLNPLDARKQEDADWLRALIWPEHAERRDLLEAALAIRQTEDVTMVAGDGVALLPSLLASIPHHVAPFVFHTHVAYQMPRETKDNLLAEIDRQGAQRDIIHLHNNIVDYLHATAYRNGERIDIPISDADAHARWVEWRAPATPQVRTGRT